MPQSQVTPLTKTAFAQQSIRIFESCSFPSWLGEIVGQELQHDCLLLVPSRLPPETLNQFMLS
jgi:hypothetical protein